MKIEILRIAQNELSMPRIPRIKGAILFIRRRLILKDKLY